MRWQADEVLAFWFPDGHENDLERHREQWMWWMRGGADEAIRARFGDLVQEAGRGELEHWADEPRGRLALVLVLDQFPRSLFSGRADAYAHDVRALELVLEGLGNGHYEALGSVWEKTFFGIPLVHAEGPDAAARAQRCVDLAEGLIDLAPQHLRPMYEFAAEQARKHRRVLQSFGRHPHRNQLLGRSSTDAELAYLEAGDFPHLTDIAL